MANSSLLLHVQLPVSGSDVCMTRGAHAWQTALGQSQSAVSLHQQDQGQPQSQLQILCSPRLGARLM